jgi:hypothetical protein
MAVRITFVGGPFDGGTQMVEDLNLAGSPLTYTVPESYLMQATVPINRGQFARYTGPGPISTWNSRTAKWDDSVVHWDDGQEYLSGGQMVVPYNYVSATAGVHPEGPVAVPTALQPQPYVYDANVFLSSVTPAPLVAGQSATVNGNGLMSVASLTLGGQTISSSAFTSLTNLAIGFTMPAMASGSYTLSATVIGAQTANKLPVTVQ